MRCRRARSQAVLVSQKFGKNACPSEVRRQRTLYALDQPAPDDGHIDCDHEKEEGDNHQKQQDAEADDDDGIEDDDEEGDHGDEDGKGVATFIIQLLILSLLLHLVVCCSSRPGWSTLSSS